MRRIVRRRAAGSALLSKRVAVLPTVMLLCLLPFAALAEVRSLPLEYLDAAEAVDAIRPVLKRGESVTGAGDTLMLAAGAETQRKVQAMLKVLDTPPENLLVSIRRKGSRVAYRETGYLVARPADEAAQTRSTSSAGARAARVLSGGRVFVQTGPTSASLTGHSVVSNGIGRRLASVTDVKMQQKGIWLSPRVRGEKVWVKVSSEVVASAAEPAGSVDYASVYKGRLGEWLSLSAEKNAASTKGRDVWSTAPRSPIYEDYEIRVMRLSP